MRRALVTLLFLSTIALAAPQPKPTPLRFDPRGPDRNCPDFYDQAEAQRFFIAAGGPKVDRHRLDRNHNGIACEETKRWARRGG